MSAEPDTRPAIPEAVRDPGVVAIARGLEPDVVVAIGEALREGGVRAFEVTLNSPSALDAIASLASRFPDGELLVGAGTVLDIDSAEAALEVGARFLVMPHTDTGLVRWVADRGVPAFPGAMTPGEILAGWRAGAAAVKLFPASVLGPAFIREFRGPFPAIPLIPTGGVTLESAPAFVSGGAAAVGLGSWLTGSGDPIVVRQRASEIVAAVEQARR